MINSQAFAKDLLHHYDSHARDLPWRQHMKTLNQRPDPYHIWISEIMLQQTTVATVMGYFDRFLEAFPTIFELADADEQDVLHLWQGLGYYSRARNLHKCAKTLVAEHDSIFPQSYDALIKLPGIGPYTAAAIAAIAFDLPETVVDGNVERVISRVFNIHTPLPDAKKEIKPAAERLTPQKRAGDYAGAIMDLGATICTPKSPKCEKCPVIQHCSAEKLGTAAELPKKRRKAAKPQKQGIAWIFMDDKGRIYLRKRPEKGLLANLWEVPSQGWEDEKRDTSISKNLLTHCDHYIDAGKIRHVFTHFALDLEVRLVQLEETKTDWFETTNLPPLPTLMKKVLETLNDD